MKLKELEAILISSNIPSHEYSLKGGLPNEAYCIEERRGKWFVYYSQRGARTNEKEFDNEQAACDCFLSWIGSDSSFKNQLRNGSSDFAVGDG